MARLNREESRAITRTNLIASAKRVFSERGIGGATIDDIAEGANYSKGAFYSNFSSKEEIFIELLKLHMNEELVSLRQVAHQVQSLDEFMDELTRFYSLMEQQADVCILALEFQMSAYRNAVLLAPFRALFDGHRVVLSELLEQVAHRAGAKLLQPAQEIITTLMGMTNGLLLQRLVSASYKSGSAPDMIVLYLRSVMVQ